MAKGSPLPATGGDRGARVPAGMVLPPIQDMAGARQTQQLMWEHSSMGKVGSRYANDDLHV